MECSRLLRCWAAAGHWELRLRRDGGADGDGGAPRPIASPALCAGLSWLLPGLGHAKAGQKDKGLLVGAAVTIVFALGLAPPLSLARCLRLSQSSDQSLSLSVSQSLRL